MRTTGHIALLAVAALVLALLGGCSGSGRGAAMPVPGPRSAPPAIVRLGTMETEDVLPIWAAQQSGTFDKVGLTVKVVPFATAQARDAAFKAGTIDGFIGDTFTVAKLRDQGDKARIVTLCLGATPSQGRVGIVTAHGSRLRVASQLATVPIGTSLGTMEEFVLDGLLPVAGRTRPLAKRDVESLPDRFDLLMKGKLRAAVLPEPYLSLAIRRRAHLVASDIRGLNLSQTVMAFSDSYLASPGGASAVNRLLGAWDAGSSNVNSHRKVFRPVLVADAHFPTALAKHYRMNTYPHHQLPTKAQIAAVVTWMQDKGLLRDAPSYADVTWMP